MSYVYLGDVPTEDLEAELKLRRKLAEGKRCPECHGKRKHPKEVSDGFDMLQCCNPYHYEPNPGT